MLKRYGGSDHYTHGLVERTLVEEKLGSKYSGYALAMFLNTSDAIAALGEEKTYYAIRKEVAIKYFNGNLDFVVRNLQHSGVGNSGGGSGYVA